MNLNSPNSFNIYVLWLKGSLNKKIILPNGYCFRYANPKVESVCIKLEENQTVIFRQCFPHHGMSYAADNVRLFFYCDLVARDEDRFIPLNLSSSQYISEVKLLKTDIHVPAVKKHIKKIVKKKQKITIARTLSTRSSTNII